MTRGSLRIGIILSGMGTDGTLGLKAIKEKMGLVMVQDISSAKYDGMPQSAINTGIADIVAPVNELPARLQSYANHSPSHDRKAAGCGKEDYRRTEQDICPSPGSNRK